MRANSADRNLRDFDQGGEVSIPLDGLSEPRLHRAATGGMREGLLPGNKKYLQGDKIPKGKSGGGGGGNGEGGADGRGR